MAGLTLFKKTFQINRRSSKCNLLLNINSLFSRAYFPGNKTKILDIDLHYEQVGSGAHKVLLLPGALGSTRTDFSPQLEKLDRSVFTIVAWDPPGYGYSRPPNRKFPKDFYHNDAKLSAALMEKLGHSKYSVLGWSDGGITGLILASWNPQVVQKLVIWGASSFFTKHDAELLEATRDITKWSEKMRTPLETLYGKEYFKKTWENYVDSLAEYVSETGTWDIGNSEVKNIQCSTLIVHGDKDPIVPLSHPKYLLENIKNSRLHRMPEGKHNIHLRYADEFNKLVQNFICE